MPLAEQNLVRIFEAMRAITSTLELSVLLKTVMGLAGEVVQAEVSSLLLVDPSTGELYFDVALGEKGGALQQIRLKKGEGIAGWVAENRQPAVVNDVAHDPRWTQRADDTTKFKTRSILAVPMLVRDKLVGVVEAINRADGQPFSDEDRQMLELFASQAAVAIENARLFESVRQEKEKMATILQEMSEGTILLDDTGRVVLSNLAARTLLDRPSLDSLTWRDLESVFEIKPDWNQLRAVGPSDRAIELTRRSGPTLILSGLVTQLRNDRQEAAGYLVIFSNVTEERREAQLKRNFLSLVSHKLKTPLVAIRGFTPMLLEKPEELNAFQKTAIEAIDRSGQLLTSLVEKLVWFSALEGETLALERKPQTFAPILDGAVAELSSFLSGVNAEVKQEASVAALPTISVDKMWIHQVFRNLIENAIKFNPREPRQLVIKGECRDRLARISFVDNGPGIPSEERAKIFQKFYQIDSAFTGQVQGMGLGLALVKRVVEEHGGDVSLDSALGQGSTFTLSFPVSSQTV